MPGLVPAFASCSGRLKRTAAHGTSSRTSSRSRAARRFDRLTFLGWSGGALPRSSPGLPCRSCCSAISSIYYRNADMDFMVIYSALAMNAGHPQQFMDHTAYLTILTVKSWFALLHQLGLLDAWTLPAMPKDAAAAFDAAMTHAVRAGARAGLPDRHRQRRDLRRPVAADLPRLARGAARDAGLCAVRRALRCICASCAANSSPPAR